MPRRSQAFTLIEVLLAMSLAVLLLGAIYWTLAAGFDAHDRAGRVIGPPRAAAIALDTLHSDLRGAVMPSSSLAVEFLSTQATSAAGHPAHRLVFYTTADTAGEERTAGLRRVEWALEPAADSSAAEPGVLTRWVTDNLLAPVTPEPVAHVITDNVRELSFSFYDGVQWVETWDAMQQANALPVAVQVTLTLALPEREQQANDEEANYTVVRVIALPAGVASADGGLSR